MLVYTITDKESCTCEPKTVYQTRTCTEKFPVVYGALDYSTSAYTTEIVSSNCNATSIYSVSIRGQEEGSPTGGGVGCNNYANFTKIFYVSNGQKTIEEKNYTRLQNEEGDPVCEFSQTLQNFNIPSVGDRFIISTSTTQTATVISKGTTNNFITVPTAVFVSNQLSTTFQFTQGSTSTFQNTTTTVNNTVTSKTNWTFGYSNADGDYSPAIIPNFVSTRIELIRGEGVWYPTKNLSELTNKSDIDIKAIMTYTEFPATVNVHPYVLSSAGAIAEAACTELDIFQLCNSPKLTTSSSVEVKTETITVSSNSSVNYTTNILGITFPLSTTIEEGAKKTTRTSNFLKTNILVTNVDTFTKYASAMSTFKVSLDTISWAETYLNVQTTKNTIRSSLTYTRSETAELGDLECKTTRKITWSELYHLCARANPSIFAPREIKKYFLYGEAVPSVTNNFNLQVKAGNLTLEKVSYGSYVPNVKVLLPLKYTYSSSTALVNGDGIKLTIKKSSGVETTFYPFSPNGDAISKQVYIQNLSYGACKGGFIIGGVSPDGKKTNSIVRLSVEGLYASLIPFSSNTELKQSSLQEKVPVENSTAYYPLNSNIFHIVISNITDFYISTKRDTNLNQFLSTISCGNNNVNLNILSL
jgi:hypothetical protein